MISPICGADSKLFSTSLPKSSIYVFNSFKLYVVNNEYNSVVTRFSLPLPLEPNIKIPYVFEYGKGISNIYYLVYASMQSKLIIQNKTYYEVPKMNIKENGLNNLIGKLETMQSTIYSEENMNLLYKYYYKEIYSEFKH